MNGGDMREFKPVLSDDPKDLEGAVEWSKAEIERMEKEEKSQKVLMEHMRPIIMEIAMQRGLVTRTVE